MDDGSPTLEVGFAIDTGGSFAELLQLQSLMNSTEAKIVADAAKIERATGGMLDLGKATASISAFGNASTRELQNLNREKARTEKAGEALIRQLERETAALGRTKEEMRDLRVEAIALAAADQKNTDLADRLLGASRQNRFKAEALAEDRAAAADLAAQAALRERAAAEAAVNAQLMERARLEAAIERNTGVGRLSAVQSGATFSALAERERAIELAERETAAERDLIAAQRQQNNLLAERANIESTLERTTGLGRPRAMDSGATFSALAARAAQEEASATTAAAASAERLAREHAALVVAVRGSQAAMEADAAAAERLRSSTDPLYASTKRLNDEIAESTRLYHAGVTPSAEYARQQQVLTERLRDVAQGHDAHGRSMARAGAAARLSRGDMLNLGYQINDVIVSLVSGQKPFMVFAQQGAQIGQIAASSGVGLAGMARSIGALLLPFAPLVAGVAVAAGGLALFVRDVEKGVDTKSMVNSLGLTRQEIKRLKDVSVDTGDVMTATFQVLAQRIGIDLSNIKDWFGSALDFMAKTGRQYLAALYSEFVGTFRAIGIIVRDVFAGKGIGEILSDVGKGYKDAFNEADAAMVRFGGDVTKQVASNKLKELQKQAAEIKLDRTPKVDHHAEQLAREAAATEAQIRNLYRLADAYGVSDAAAMKAEVRAKAESAGIKKRADVEEYVERQLRLAVAERVRDAAKASADLNAQANAQESVNKRVAEGRLPAEQANDALRDEIALRPILAAIQNAEGKAREHAIDEFMRLEQAQVRSNAAAREAREIASLAAGENQLAMLREEVRLIGATNVGRIRALALLKATQEAAGNGFGAAWITQQVDIAVAQERLTSAQDRFNNLLPESEDAVKRYASAFGEAFGNIGGAISRVTDALVDYGAERRKIAEQVANGTLKEREAARASAQNQIGAYADITGAAKSMFSERSKIYKALQAAETVFRAVQLALSIKKMVQDAAETASTVVNAGVRATAEGTAGIASQAKLPFPANIAAMAATAAALVAIGVAITGGIGGGKNSLPKANDGTGTVLGDPSGKSESIQRSLDMLGEIDDATLTVSRGMLNSLRSIENSIGGLSTLLVRAGNIDASGGVNEGFNSSLSSGKLAALGLVIGGPIGAAVGAVLTKIPVVGNILKGLFGTKTTVVGSGLYGDAQTVGDILGSGFDADYYSDVKKKKKFFGISAGTKYSTKYTDADAGIEDQFGLLIRQFYEVIGQAAVPLGASLDAVQQRLLGFTVDIGKIDLQGLTGDEIEEKLQAVFGAAADRMAEAALPGLSRFQKVGEGAFETLVRVSSTVEQVDAAFQRLGVTSGTLGIDIDMAIAGMFDSVSDFTGAADAYFQAFYSDAERAAAETARMGKAFASLGLTMPDTLAGFRGLVEAQDLTTAAGQQMYATLLQLAPAFADLKGALDGAASAAAIVRQREDLQRRLLELNGDTAAIRAAELAKVDVSNRALQEQIYAIQDAQEAAKAATQLRDAWKSAGDTILDEVKRIRGLNTVAGGGTFASLMGQFNVANALARSNDAGAMNAAKSLPQLSKSLLDAAALAATSRQELDRVQAQTAAALEATYAAIGGLTGAVEDASPSLSATAAPTGTTASMASELSGLRADLADLKAELAALRSDNNAGHAATAGNTGRVARKLDDVTAASGGDAISVTSRAA